MPVESRSPPPPDLSTTHLHARLGRRDVQAQQRSAPCQPRQQGLPPAPGEGRRGACCFRALLRSPGRARHFRAAGPAGRGLDSERLATDHLSGSRRKVQEGTRITCVCVVEAIGRATKPGLLATGPLSSRAPPPVGRRCRQNHNPDGCKLGCIDLTFSQGRSASPSPSLCSLKGVGRTAGRRWWRDEYDCN